MTAQGVTTPYRAYGVKVLMGNDPVEIAGMVAAIQPRDHRMFAGKLDRRPAVCARRTRGDPDG